MKDVKAKESQNKFFTVEFFGVTLIVFSFVMLICLIFGYNVLFEIGREIQYSILGIAGYFSYPILVCLLYVGFMLLFGKKIIASNLKGRVLLVLLFVFLAGCLLNVITGAKTAETYSGYLSDAFLSGRQGVSGVYAGGVIFSLITYPLVRYLTYVGGIIAISAIILISMVIAIKNASKYKISVSGKKEYPGELPKEQPENQTTQTPEPEQNPNANPQYANPNGYQNGYGGYNNYPQGAFGGAYPNAFNRGGQPTNTGDYTQGYSNPYTAYENGYNGGYNNPQPVNSPYNNFNNNQQPKQDDLQGSTYSQSIQDVFGGSERKTTIEDYTPNPYNNNDIVSNPISKDIVEPDYDYKDGDTFSNYSIDDFANVQKAETFIDDFSSESVSTKKPTPIKDYFKKEEPIIEETVIEETAKIDEEQKVEIQPEKPKDNRKIIENMPINYNYVKPPISLLNVAVPVVDEATFQRFIEQKSKIILDTLAHFGIETTIAEYHRGPAVTRFDIVVPLKVKTQDIQRLYPEINRMLAGQSDSRFIERIPNSPNVGIEVPNPKADMVSLREIINSSAFKVEKPDAIYFALGKNIIGESICLDIAEMPHLLIAGTTGSGKSVCLNSLITSLVYKYSPTELRFVIVDPKMVEFSMFQKLPHMLFGEIIDSVPYCNSMLTWAVQEMNRRYAIMSQAGVKKLSDYNKKMRAIGGKTLFRIVLIIDEFGDFILQDRKGIGEKITTLVQKSRAAGIHLVVATQRPSADIIAGPIKTNLPARIVFKVSSGVDSGVALDTQGAQRLLGRGDCLYKTLSDIERAMGAYVSDEECEAVCSYISQRNESYYDLNSWAEIESRVSDHTQLGEIKEGTKSSQINEFVELGDKAPDQLMGRAIRVSYDGGISASMLVRKLSIGTNRAGRMVDWLLDNGYIEVEIKNGKRQFTFPKEQLEEKIAEIENWLNPKDDE